ncbi:MAG: TonB-dependent receptor [Chitinophagaceae bacterium]|nr:TonB-dependent receptor [Chitinophagaceae bacterium]
MKLTAALLVCTILQVGARSVAQKVSLSERNAAPEKVFTLIEKQTGYKFIYTETFLQKANPITIHLRNAPLEQALTECFSNQSYTWSILNKMIIIKEKPQPKAGAVSELPDLPPPIDVKGEVRDEKGNPIIGATIAVKGMNQSTATGLDGSFVLKGVEKNAVIVVSYTGYKTEEVPLRGRSEISLSMSINVRALNEIVVVGYGTVRKRDLTGSVSQVKPAEVTSYPTNNIVNALQGRATGVFVQQNNGAPGGNISIRIRGTNSILGGNEPLYVIDGFPFSGNPTFLQNSDIESIEILKDASSIAIYGSRGANGVIIITTRSGKSGKTLVDLETGYSTQSPMKYIKLMNGRQYAQFYNEQAANDGVAPYFTQQQIDSFAKGPNTDWQRQVMHNAPMLTTNLNISGGNEKTKFALSSGVFRQDGIIRNSNYNRYTLRGTLSHDLSKIFNVSYNIYLTRVDARYQNSGSGNRGGDLISGMLMAPPTLTPYLPDGSFRRLNTAYSFISNVIVNPLVTINKVSDKIRSDKVFSNAALTIKPIKDLSIRISGGVQNENNRTDTYYAIEPSTNSTGSASVGTTQTTSLLNENVATYSKNLGEHRLTLTGGFTYQDYVSTTLNGSGTGFLSDVIGTGSLGSATTPGIPASGYQKWTLLSYLGRFNYSYADKYLATVSFRRDGSSRYSKGNKWSNFPSAALAWHMSSEPFLKSSHVVSDLKIRASYGATGSTAVNPYQTLNQLGSGYTIFGDALSTTYAPGTALPGNLKWETTDEFDAGVDAGFLDNRLRLTADVYLKKTKNLLNRVSLPASMGYITTLRNVGEVQNKGLEIGVESDIFKGPVNWTVAANISFNRNKVVKLYQGQDIYGAPIYTGSLNDYINLLREGQPMGVFYGYKEIGYTATGDIQYEDRNKDGKITADDKTYIGNPNPRFTYGFNSVTAYKGFELTVFIQGTQGNDIYNLNMSSSLDLGMGLNLTQDQFYNHWTSSNTKAKYPRVSRNLSGNMSSRFVENGSYLRFRNIQLAYNLPVDKWRVSWCRSLQLYASGQNLITLTKYSWYDPDINTYGSSNSYTQGIDYYTYPTYKSVTFGLRCGF